MGALTVMLGLTLMTACGIGVYRWLEARRHRARVERLKAMRRRWAVEQYAQAEQDGRRQRAKEPAEFRDLLWQQAVDGDQVAVEHLVRRLHDALSS